MPVSWSPHGASIRPKTHLAFNHLRRIPHNATLQGRRTFLSIAFTRNLASRSSVPKAYHVARRTASGKLPSTHKRSDTPGKPRVRKVLVGVRGEVQSGPDWARKPANTGDQDANKKEQLDNSGQQHVNPSQVLSYALEKAGYHYAVPHSVSGKVDLSGGRAIKTSSGEKEASIGGDVEDARANSTEASFDPTKKLPLPTNLQLIVASTISELPLRDSDRRFSKRWYASSKGKARWNIIHYLEKHGYTERDVLDWCGVLTEKSGEKAALRILRLCNRLRDSEYEAVPVFVLLYLLRRGHLTAQSLQHLIRHATDRTFRQHDSEYESVMEGDTLAHKAQASDMEGQAPKTASYGQMQPDPFVLLIIRLIRHARQVWPAGLTAIANLVTKYFVPSTMEKMGSRRQQSLVFNKLLQLLGLPSNQTPFLSIPYHQRAQFQVVRHMSKCDPPLPLNREGYRAIARVQLAHRKSMSEREWAVMKSATWPPYKQDRTGLDADVGVEHGISRARETLSKSNESGFELDSWEQAGMILSGWDIDDTPTIQTRAIMKLRRGIVRTEQVPSVSEYAEADSLWPSRIKATRTLDEAWATFLSYKQSCAAPSENAYFEMASKIVFNGLLTANDPVFRRDSAHHASTDSAGKRPFLPGDGREVAAAPRDPRESVYVHIPPPTLMSFIQSAIADRIQLRGEFLALLVQYARTLDECAFYFKHSTISQETVSMLLGQQASKREPLSRVPNTVFAAFIQHLTRSGHPLPFDFELVDVGSEVTKVEMDNKINQIIHAFRLVLVLRPQQRRPWHSLVSALTEEITRLRTQKYANLPLPHDVHLWKLTLDVVSDMRALDLEVDASMFRLLCVAFSKAARASNGWMMSNAQFRVKSETDKVLQQGLEQLKGLFRRIVAVGTDDEIAIALDEQPKKVFPKDQQTVSSADIMPRIAEVPHPSHLHAFIRALGTVRDFEGIRDLVKWMVRHAPEINVIREEARNGHSQIRRCLAAVRVYLEGDLVREIVSKKDELTKRRFNTGQAPEELIQEVFELVEQVDEWRGWPPDEEMDNYCQPQDLPVRVLRKV